MAERLSPSIGTDPNRSKSPGLVHGVDVFQADTPPYPVSQVSRERAQLTLSRNKATASHQKYFGALAAAIAKFRRPLKDSRKKLHSSVEVENVSREEKLQALLSSSPFSFLTHLTTDDPILDEVQQFHFEEGDQVLWKGDRDDSGVYIITKGQVLLTDLEDRDQPLVSFISAPGLFGEWSPVCQQPREHDVVAAESCVIWRVSNETYKNFYRTHVAFRLALIRKIQVKRGVFKNLDSFRKLVAASHSKGSINFSDVLEDYSRLRPALHSKINSHSLDVDAWIYAVRRLPSNIASTYVFLMVKEIPTMYLTPSVLENSVETAARRRHCFKLAEGKNLILIREDYTDLLDFISLLCIHAHETSKLRKRFSGTPTAFPLLVEYMAAHKNDADERPEDQKRILSHLPLEEDEKKGLLKIWEKDLLHRLWDMILHHNDYSLVLELRPHFTTDSRERWTEQIRQNVINLIGTNWTGYEFDIISSNTHSVVNLLCPVLQREKDVILSWGRKAQTKLSDAYFKVPSDKLYALTYSYEKANPDKAKARHAELRKLGFIRLSVTQFTGIAVDIILLDALEQNIDPTLSEHSGPKKRVIINIDYCFAKQAEDILQALCLLFGKAIRSVNVLGKAGGLEGHRGDIAIASEIVRQRKNSIIRIANEGLNAKRIQEMSGREVRTGPALTVDGTVIQDKNLLMFYKEFFNCVCLEMEGNFYAKTIVDNRENGILRPDIAARFLYYISDLPLQPESTLSAGMAPWEGIPPLYAVTRAILEQILGVKSAQ